MKQISILTENKPGVLADVAGILGTRGVNVESISAETFPDGAVIRIVTNDTTTAVDALKKANYRVTESDILIVNILDRPGELGKITKKIASEDINIDNIYMISKKDTKAVLALKVNQHEKAAKLLREHLEHS